MKHPSDEQWMEFLYEELPAESQAKLSAHLEVCQVCASQVKTWRGTIQTLDTWKLPIARKSKALASFSPAWRWAAAAAIILSTGYAAGRFNSSQPDLGQMQSTLRKNIEKDLRQELDEKLNSQLIATLDNTRARILSEVSNRIDEVSQRTLAEAANTSRKQVEALGATFSNLRDEDKKAVLTSFQQIENQRLNDLLSQRKDLETVAVHTEQSFAKAHRQLVQLAGFTQPTSDHE